ncbi:MAG: riboflavin synthase [Deltaproteobacteria bacterium]|nr:riboflavin synthase [Deltaproteobacteria bacterium]
MFTGIIEGPGTISGIKPSGHSRRMAINADYELDNTKIGDSIAVNGACLTVVSFSGRRFEVDVSPETVAKTTLGKARIGDRVNLERALRISDRIDGHLVSGHIDGIGTIKSRKTEENAIIITFNIPESVAYYIIKKGSVAVDGISLTVNECDHESFQVSIIPHTAKLTTLGFKKISDSVNVETDMIGKYVERFVTQTQSGENKKEAGKSSIDMQFLAKTGFL